MSSSADNGVLTRMSIIMLLARRCTSRRSRAHDVMVSEGRVTGGPRLPIMGGASGAEASSVAPPACARACARLRPIPRDRQATVRRASLTSGRGRGAGCVGERTVVWLRGRRPLAKEVDHDPSWWLIDRLPGGDGRSPTGSGMPQVGSDDDAIEVAIIPEPAQPCRIRRARKCYRGEQERDGNENHRHDGSYQTHARKPSANMAGLQLWGSSGKRWTPTLGSRPFPTGAGKQNAALSSSPL